MPTASIKKTIRCSKKDLIDLVLDIEKYPLFVPWCLDSKIHNKIDKGNTLEIIADLTIGRSFFRDTYKSLVIYNKTLESIYVTNIDGPLKHLENKWYFKQIGDSSEINFHVDFELNNRILNVLMIKSFNLGLKKIADSFEKRAGSLFN